MSDDIPEMILGLGDGGKPLVMVGDNDEATDMAGLLRLVPALASAAHALELSRVMNHLVHGNDYDVIEDPQRFAAEYKARVAREDPDADWQEGVIRLRDHGMPDFAAILAPAFAGGRLSFYAVDRFLGLPYRVETAALTATPLYEPVALTPIPRKPRPAGEPELHVVPPVPPEIANVKDFEDDEA